MPPKNLFEKIWDAHVIHTDADGASLLHIDRHLVHEVTSPQAFECLRDDGSKLRRPDLTLAVAAWFRRRPPTLVEPC
jgi:3-isopropylmalate/(R)-2-methylmalate dehydratase large subunit